MALRPADLAKLTPAEQGTFIMAAEQVACDLKPSMMTIVDLLLIIERLIAEPAELTAEGAGPLLDPDCRDGKHTSCVGAPCDCTCHRAAT